MSNHTDPSSIDLPKRRTQITHADLLILAREAGAGEERSALSAQALSAAEWTDWLAWVDRVSMKNGWQPSQAEILIQRLKARHQEVWGSLTTF